MRVIARAAVTLVVALLWAVSMEPWAMARRLAVLPLLYGAGGMLVVMWVTGSTAWPGLLVGAVAGVLVMVAAVVTVIPFLTLWLYTVWPGGRVFTTDDGSVVVTARRHLRQHDVWTIANAAARRRHSREGSALFRALLDEADRLGATLVGTAANEAVYRKVYAPLGCTATRHRGRMRIRREPNTSSGRCDHQQP